MFTMCTMLGHGRLIRSREENWGEGGEGDWMKGKGGYIPDMDVEDIFGWLSLISGAGTVTRTCL